MSTKAIDHIEMWIYLLSSTESQRQILHKFVQLNITHYIYGLFL